MEKVLTSYREAFIQSSRNTGVACSIKTHAFRRVKLSTKVL